ncbi:MAG: integrase core domain-containing protein [Thermodesulfobacteriota bacterium]
MNVHAISAIATAILISYLKLNNNKVYNDCSWTIPELNRELKQWEYIYNCVRPHQALGYKTQLQFLKNRGIIHTNYPSTLSHMY